MRTGEYQAWMDRADCAQTDPELFFPEKGANDGHHAKQVCRGCPVVNDCLAYAVTDPSLDGIWGGLSYRERQAVRAELRGIAA